MEQYPILKSKLAPPRFGIEMVPRPRLLRLLKDFKRTRATLITAPAGYGKTVLMIQILKHWAKPAIWYQLDGFYNDPAIFIQYLISGIKKYYPGFGDNVVKLLCCKGIYQKLPDLSVILMNDLASLPGDGLILVIDDYHCINNPSIHQLMSRLLHHLPLNIHLVVSSRIRIPWSSISKAEASGWIKMIDTSALCFTRGEIKTLLAQKNQESSVQLIDDLEVRSEGWPLAVALLIKTLIKGASPQTVNNETHLHDYFLSEVLELQSGPNREFLLNTSVLEELTPKLCDLMLNRNDSAQILKHLEQEQLFIVPLRGKDDSYRYHPLFREFLLERLGAGRKEVLRKAGTAAEQTGEAERAVEYYLAAEDFKAATRLIKRGGRQVIRLGCWQTISRWLDTLPAESIASDPWLKLYRAEVLINRGMLIEAQNYLERAREEFENRQEWAGVTETLVQQARVLRFYGRYQESLALLERATPQLITKKTRDHFHLLLEQSINLAWSGKIIEAEAVLKKALKTAEPENDSFISAHLSESLGNIIFMKGDYFQAMDWYRRSESGLSETALTGYLRRNNKAIIYLEWNEPDRALEEAQQEVAYKERLGLTEALPLAYLQLGMVYLERSELQAAEAYLSRSIMTEETGCGERFFFFLSRILLARCLGMQGKLIEARTLVDKVLREAKTQSDYTLAVCQTISAPVLIMGGEMEEAVRLLMQSLAPLEASGADYFTAFCSGFLAGLC